MKPSILSEYYLQECLLKLLELQFRTSVSLLIIQTRIILRATLVYFSPVCALPFSVLQLIGQVSFLVNVRVALCRIQRAAEQQIH
jgi:hypothetical protein